MTTILSFFGCQINLQEIASSIEQKINWRMFNTIIKACLILSTLSNTKLMSLNWVDGHRKWRWKCIAVTDLQQWHIRSIETKSWNSDIHENISTTRYEIPISMGLFQIGLREGTRKFQPEAKILRFFIIEVAPYILNMYKISVWYMCKM